MKKYGFTLIEVICTVAIIGIISSIAIPVSLKYIEDSKEKRYLIEAKLIENATDIYNYENINNKILESDSMENVKNKLLNKGKKYLDSWPKTILVLSEGENIKVEEYKLGNYTYENLLKYSRNVEEKIK